MAPLIPDLCADLEAETAGLVDQLAGLDEAGWAASTPAAGWVVKDQVVHLAFFDNAVTSALTDPDRFRNDVVETMKQLESFVDATTTANRHRPGAEILEWFRSTRATMVATFVAADPSLRVPWYGPEMSVASALTARIMETWAHGQDVFDGFGVEHPPTAALRQVAHIGVRALPNSFVTRGRQVPTDPVRVELTAPDDARWDWGPTDAANRVAGPAEDFCLVVTQRRHPADTEIVASGDVATEWMNIAQAFAGPPGSGRRPGEFLRPRH